MELLKCSRLEFNLIDLLGNQNKYNNQRNLSRKEISNYFPENSDEIIEFLEKNNYNFKKSYREIYHFLIIGLVYFTLEFIKILITKNFL